MADATSIINAAQRAAESAAANADRALESLDIEIASGGFDTEFKTDVNMDSVIESLSKDAQEIIADLAEAATFEESLEPPANEPTLDQLDTLTEPDITTKFGSPPKFANQGLFKTQLPGGFDEDPPKEPPGMDAALSPISEPTIDNIGHPDLVEIGDTLTKYDIPTYEQINPFPIFDEQDPGPPPEPPERVLERYEAAYNRMVPEMKAFIDGCVDNFLNKFDVNHIARMDNLNDRVDAYLEGGSGLNEQVEQAIYDRGRGRVHAENRAAEQTAWDQVAAKGFSMPQGLLMQELRRSGNDAANRNGQLSMDIVKLQADLEQKNLQFAVSQSIALRTAIRNAAIQYSQALLQINRDALEFAKQFVDAVIRIYELAVRAWQSTVEYLKSRIQLYEARLRAALADVEIFRAKVEAVGLVNDINKNKVDLYKMRVDLEQTKIELFAAKISAQQNEINRRQNLVSIYQSLVQAFSAKVQAKSAEFQGYAAAIDGDKAVLQSQIARLDSYRAKIEATSLANQAQVTAVAAQAENNRSIIEKFRAEMDAWLRKFDQKDRVFDAKYKIKDQEIRSYATMAQNQISQRGLAAEYNRGLANANIQKVQAEATAHNGTMNAKAARARTKIEGAAAGARTAAGIATGALSAQNTLVQVADITQS